MDKGRGDGGRGRGRGRSGRGNNRWAKCECHNCGKLGHIERHCWLPGGGAYKPRDSGDGGGGASEGDSFPGTDGDAISRPPRGNEPRHKKLTNGDEVVWCSTCSLWTNHFTSGHPAASESVTDGDSAAPAANLGENKEENEEITDGGAFSRLRLAGLI